MWLSTEDKPMANLEEQRSLPVVAAGPGWLVVDKPSGVSVHNDPGRDVCSSVSAMLVRDRQLADRTAFAGDGVHAPHRLDRDTSGLVLLCCTMPMLRFFGRAFQEGRIGKRYLAILHGRLEPLEGADGRGVWSFPLAQAGGGRANPSGQGQRVVSRTAFEVLRYSSHYTLVACSPLTGRTHQIRRHAKLAGHPVVGDRRYGSPRSLRYLREAQGFERLGLHACGLDLPLPSLKEHRVVYSRALPPELIRLLVGDSEQPDAEWQAVLPGIAGGKRWSEN
jgi:23S rRNA-/tRNA-specific pseudouridylate synthase